VGQARQNRQSEVVAVAGDWHGNRVFAVQQLHALGERGVRTVLHAGDFGIWPGRSGKAFLRAVDAACSRAGVEQMLVTPGNHEDWGRLTQLWANPKRSGLPLDLGEHVAVLPRGYRWSMGGRTFVSLGGAPSVDRELRTEGRDWWPEEMIEPDHVAQAAAGGTVDVMITHDSADTPYSTPRVKGIVQTNPMGWSDAARDYARLGRARITEAVLAIGPRLLVHGHYHVDDETVVTLPGRTYATAIWSLGCDGMAGNVRLLDLGSLGEPSPEPSSARRSDAHRESRTMAGRSSNADNQRAATASPGAAARGATSVHHDPEGVFEAERGSELAELVGPFWSESRAAEALGVTTDELVAWGAEGRVLAVATTEGIRFYPVAQFEIPEGTIRIRRGVRVVLKELRDREPWTIAVVLNMAAPELDDLTPLQWMRRGNDLETLAAYARQLDREWRR
jgi:hypothetical protein